MAKPETWRELLLLAGIVAPIWWSGYKHKKVFNQLMSGDIDLNYLKELQVKEGNVFNIEPTELPEPKDKVQSI
jgi:hypothetical protein